MCNKIVYIDFFLEKTVEFHQTFICRNRELCKDFTACNFERHILNTAARQQLSPSQSNYIIRVSRIEKVVYYQRELVIEPPFRLRSRLASRDSRDKKPFSYTPTEPSSRESEQFWRHAKYTELLPRSQSALHVNGERRSVHRHKPARYQVEERPQELETNLSREREEQRRRQITEKAEKEVRDAQKLAKRVSFQQAQFATKNDKIRKWPVVPQGRYMRGR